MNTKVEQALKTVLRNWGTLAGAESDAAESVADEFESSFYLFIDAVREWMNSLDERPNSLEQLLQLPDIIDIVDRLPAPLYLNFETEAELILENKDRVDEDKYD